MSSKCAYVTLLSTPSYLDGVKVLYKSLEKYGKTKYPFVCLCSKGLAQTAVYKLKKWGIPYMMLQHNAMEGIPMPKQQDAYAHWNYTFDKLLIWELEEFEKIVFIDSDMMILKPIDELFEKPELSAVAAGHFLNPEWTKLNSGLMVLKPSKVTANKLRSLIVPTIEEFAKEGKSVSDQDVINNYWKEWPSSNYLHLSEEYNVFYKHLPDYIKNGLPSPRIIHFVGSSKPWYPCSWRKKIRTFYWLYRHRRACLEPYLKYQLLLF